MTVKDWILKREKQGKYPLAEVDQVMASLRETLVRYPEERLRRATDLFQQFCEQVPDVSIYGLAMELALHHVREMILQERLLEKDPRSRIDCGDGDDE